MKFVIEAVGLKVAGGKELALDLIRYLKNHTAHEFVFALPDLPEYREAIGENGCAVWFRECRGLWNRHRILNRTIPEICRRERADALLCLGNLPPRKPCCPTLVLLQNARIVYRDRAAESELTLRERLILEYGRRHYRHLPGKTCVIVQTEVMRERLCSANPVDPSDVSVIPNALCIQESGKFPPGAMLKAANNGGIFTFLFLSRYYPHKNFETLVDAMEKLTRHTRTRARCLITISRDQHPGAGRLLRTLQSPPHGAVQNIGPVPQWRLPELYRSADALIFPTLLESYSRTYSEAMKFDLPILTSDRDFAHCLCRDAAIYFDPLDADSIAHAMARVMDDAELRQQLVENGRRVVSRAPRWEDIAAQFVSHLEQAAGRQELALQPANHEFRFQSNAD